MSDRSGQGRVLIIEDNADAADTLREVLELDGYVVDVARSGVDGLALALGDVPDVVLCDIGLPAMDGYQVARAMRAEPSLRSTYLVALTGYALPEDVERARLAGFDRLLAKPASIDVVQRLVAQVRAGEHAPAGA